MSAGPADRIAIAGAGTVGIGWAIAFARGGAAVALHEPDAERLAAAGGELEDRLAPLERAGLIEQPAERVLSRISLHDRLEPALEGAGYVQECAPEQLELKRELFERLASAAPSAVLASSTSAIPPSRIFAGIEAAVRCLVAHPVNPPYLLPAVELVGSERTAAETVDRAERILTAAGMRPIRVHGEVEGFVVNRLQGAILREAYCLLRDGVASVDEIDRAVREGLGRRWAIAGPFETADLNTRGGIAAHARKLGPAYERMGAERGQRDPWTPELVAEAERQRRALLPLERWQQRVGWRDRQLIAQEAARAGLGKGEADDG